MNGHITQCNISESTPRTTFPRAFDLVSCLEDFRSEDHSANGHWGLFPRDGPWTVAESLQRFRKHGDVPPYPHNFHSANSLITAIVVGLSAPATGTVTNHTPAIFLWKKQQITSFITLT
jgi:hypothetical protein